MMTMLNKLRSSFCKERPCARRRFALAWRGFACAVAFASILGSVPRVSAQGSRKDDIVFGPNGHPIAGATIRVCQPTATGTPCSPLATLYTDATLSASAPNPIQSDGIGNYHFYSPSGRYMIQISGPGITGTITYPDVILAPDVATGIGGSDISAFGLTLGGDLSVAGNASVAGTLTTTNFSPTSFTPSSLVVTGNASIAGPRPHIDVTAPPYNADPSGATDSTAAIQAAIAAACARPSSLRPALFFPNGIYSVTQTQTGTSSTAPVFNVTACGAGTNLYFFSSGSVANSGQFERAPEGATINVTAGTSPNDAPIFLFSGATKVTFENMVLSAYNQAVWVKSSSIIVFKNSYLIAQNTGHTDNVPLKISNTLWVWFQHGGLQTGNLSQPCALMAGETPLTSEQPVVGLINFSDSIFTCGGIQYIQRVFPGSQSGGWTFRNITNENTNNPFLNIIESGAGVGTGVFGVTLDNVGQADSPGTPPLIQFNQTAGLLNNVTITNSSPIQDAIVIQAGTLGAYTITNSSTAPSSGGIARVVNATGQPVGLGTISEGSTFQVSNGSATKLATCSGYGTSCNSITQSATPAYSFFNQGNSLSTLALDPSQGLIFGDGVNHGYGSGMQQIVQGDVDIRTASLLPPTGFSGTATTGGSLAAGTYYGVIYATTAGCAGGVTTNSSAAYATGVSVSGANNAVNFTWTVPQATPGTPTAYCLQVKTTQLPFDAIVTQAIVISGGSTNSFLYTGQTQTPVGNVPPTSYMVSAHRFTYNSLGVNTLTPAYNLDVNGSAAVNSLNGVQEADRFAGSDVAVQINACLTAASTTSSVCDARGLTGTYTATHHISIPTHTALLWCQAKLTISDSATHDAVELAGDGASMYGCGETGTGTVPRPQTSGYIACGIAGCTTATNPNAATANIDWIHIDKMNLQATGASSTVLNVTSIGHADIENNRFVLGSGNGSYGIYGNTSTGNQDSTNSLIKHNEIDAQSQNDTCLYLAGIFNSVKVEQNSCYLPASNTGTIGFALAKDTNGNYPDNDEFDANDCEAATTSFGQICFNLIGAQNVQIGPTNRCEGVYNCIQFPADGSAVGNHMIDPYLSLSVNTMVKPNEPATAQQAMDNTGANWQPSFHYGLSDIAAPNILTNAGFEGWSNSTTLYGWGGVSGTNINQAGSGIYAQQGSGTAPADTTTQGSFNVKIGDNATAGLGIHSGCIQVDSTMNYTLAFRITSTSTSVKFRPGFRFYSDANCTEANRITSVATNARVLQPTYYAGTSALAGTGANWQSTNASLTYNNGITCNCDVTGADWNVASANTWTPTRNYAITFRVPNAYSSSSTIAQSMRVFILENTAANPNQIFVDDIALSQGPVNTKVPNAAPVTENGACVGCGINTVSTYAMGTVTSGVGAGANNQIDLSVIYLPNVTFSHITVDVSTLDASSSDFYSWAILDMAGNVKCSLSTAINLTSTGTNQQACSQGTVTLANGDYIFAFTGNATTAKIGYSGTAPLALSSAVSTSSSSAGVMTFPITIPTAGQTFSSYGLPAILLN